MFRDFPHVNKQLITFSSSQRTLPIYLFGSINLIGGQKNIAEQQQKAIANGFRKATTTTTFEYFFLCGD